MRAIITRGLYISYPIFHCGLNWIAVYITDYLCTRNGNPSFFKLKIHSLYTRAVTDQEQVIVARVRYTLFSFFTLLFLYLLAFFWLIRFIKLFKLDLKKRQGTLFDFECKIWNSNLKKAPKINEDSVCRRGNYISTLNALYDFQAFSLA